MRTHTEMLPAAYHGAWQQAGNRTKIATNYGNSSNQPQRKEPRMRSVAKAPRVAGVLR